MANGRVYRTEDEVTVHIWAMAKRHPGHWPGYVKVDGGFMTTFEPDPLPVLPSDDDELPPDDGDQLSADDGDEWGPWLDEDEAA